MKKLKGFTLIELVTVIAVLGILAGIAIPRFLDLQAQARTAKAAADMCVLQNTVEHYILAGNTISGLTDNERANADMVFGELLKKGYITDIPVPPSGQYYYAVGKISIDLHNPVYGLKQDNNYFAVTFITSGKIGISYTMFYNNFVLGVTDV